MFASDIKSLFNLRSVAWGQHGLYMTDQNGTEFFIEDKEIWGKPRFVELTIIARKLGEANAKTNKVVGINSGEDIPEQGCSTGEAVAGGDSAFNGSPGDRRSY